ncbi:MAG: sigma-54-dependent Fis family transcriptional regulator [Chrysiogenetes bacterium]|nr:sigma-54-dependent Fis family transcriptional regulator [Chrysiogenetes bacterium]
MTEALYKLLVVDDDPGVLKALRRSLIEDYVVLTAQSGEEALGLLEKHDDVACVLTDQRMPGMSGADLLARALELQPQTRRVVLTGYTDMDDVVRMINEGNIDFYLTKPWEAADLKLTLDRACESWQLRRENARLVEELRQAHAQLQRENVQLRAEVAGRYSFEGVVGNSPALREVLGLLKKVLHTDTGVLILGETGVGKEVMARALHYAGHRKDKPFVAQNCAALPETLLVSELFGHVKGSFTGAIRDKKGLFEQADGGTIFLDEIGETSPTFQQQLLRTLQEGIVWPIGSEKPTEVDVRVVAATNRDLSAEVASGNFREDLFYRLNIFPIEVPPLRARIDDIPMLAQHFLERFAGRMNRQVPAISREAMDLLQAYHWPGNVRQLENEIERALVLTEPGRALESAALSDKLRGGAAAPSTGISAPTPVNESAAGPDDARALLARHTVEEGTAIKEAVEQLEQLVLKEAIAACEGNKAAIARALGLSRMGLDKKLARYGIEVSK